MVHFVCTPGDGSQIKGKKETETEREIERG